jgi:hypothetical protein
VIIVFFTCNNYNCILLFGDKGIKSSVRNERENNKDFLAILLAIYF